MRRSRAPLLLASFLSILAAAPAAEAYERQWHVGGGLGYSLVLPGLPGESIPTTATSLHGFGAALHGTYGLTDTFNLLVQVDGSFAPGATPVVLAGGSVGIGYVVDILRVVPWFGVMAGGYAVSALDPCGAAGETGCTSGRLGFSLPVGIDYQVSRSFTVGVSGRYGVLLLGPKGGVDQMIGAYLRAEYVWGY
ncbi:hypothetical protein [Polyangium sorediatum]|uniref:Outer membrane protein beta-barrel domain-containing protein n=1 Tax=Polyangium sorediatum TaxID=889274 RepID=A0ABT6P236_9BACT|nr:hypothetical protein [Polyangium sorediatum]MDI1434662.1 hypothetical protein [Polyangium sorediatum]